MEVTATTSSPASTKWTANRASHDVDEGGGVSLLIPWTMTPCPPRPLGRTSDSGTRLAEVTTTQRGGGVGRVQRKRADRTQARL